MTDDEKYISLVVDLAIKNVENRGGPFGAAIVCNGELISTGVNEVTGKNDPTAHAEIMAIRSAAEKISDHKLENCVIYSSTEPCPMCLGAIYWSGIKKLVFASRKEDAERGGFIDAHIYREISRNFDERKLKTICIKNDNAGKEFDAWLKKPDREDY